jgi:hypothetical protein
MEDAFDELLQRLTPSQKLFGLVKAMFADAWEMRSARAHAARISGSANSRMPRSRSKA